MAIDVQASADPAKAASKDKAKIHLEVYSDNICPFCYLGYKKIVAAIAQANKEELPATFSMQFKPFILDPTLPIDHPLAKKDRYAAKFGDRAQAILAGMVERGKPWGINFSYDGPIRNTFLSHRLVEKAFEVGGETTQRALIEYIFAGYFEKMKDIGDPEYLAEAGVAAGVFEDTEEASDFLASDELKGDVCGAIRKTQSLGISGVPFTVINGKYAVSGAQEPEAFLDIFRKIACGQCPCNGKKTATA